MQNFLLIFFLISITSCANRINRAPIINITKLPQYLTNNSNVKAIEPHVDQKPAIETSQTKVNSLNTENIITTNNVNTNPKIDTNPTIPNTSEFNDINPTINSNNHWTMPTKGKALDYNESNKGIDIYGNPEQNILAANDGKVVYSGNGLKGYGNLIIIKHNDGYLTAYSKNATILVHEGQSVKLGQKIATMGQDDMKKGILHFEIRLHGKAVDPYKIISNK